MTYRVIYMIEPKPDGIEKEDIPDGWGGADALLIHSILRNDDGSYGHALLSIEGATGKPLTDRDIYQAWVMTAHSLMNSRELTNGEAQQARNAFTYTQERILEARRLT